MKNMAIENIAVVAPSVGDTAKPGYNQESVANAFQLGLGVGEAGLGDLRRCLGCGKILWGRKNKSHCNSACRSLTYSKKADERKRNAVNRREDKFSKFHHANPWIYNTLVSLARQLREKGRTRYGIKALIEVTRWHFFTQISTDGNDQDFKINNDFTALYARLIMRQEPDLKGFFETRGE